MSNSNTGFKAVTLPTALVEEIQRAAERAHRSVPKQIEHCFRLGDAIEQILPPKVANDAKAGKRPANDLLSALAEALENPPKPPPGWRVHFDPDHANKAWKTAPDGTVTYGTLLENGDFIPDTNETDQKSA